MKSKCGLTRFLEKIKKNKKFSKKQLTRIILYNIIITEITNKQF